jgi:hypothetical protein
MNKVFIAGSRKITRLSQNVKVRMDNILERNFAVLVGDANGVDKAVQQYLAYKKYEDVIIYCSGTSCRNNIGNWEEIHVTASSRKKNSFDFYTAKDLEMAQQADYGFMIWDSKSKGTLNNIMNLMRRSKKTLLYFYPDSNFYVIKNIDDLLWILNRCEQKDLDLFENSLQLSRFIQNERQLAII